MPFVLPSFPLTINIWHNWLTGVNSYALPDLTSLCNLSPGKRVMYTAEKGAAGPSEANNAMEMLLPPLTDIRPAYNSVNPDMVECPAGSKRLYLVEWVDDIAKGFANEHRFAVARMVMVDVTWKTGLITTFQVPMP